MIAKILVSCAALYLAMAVFTAGHAAARVDCARHYSCDNAVYGKIETSTAVLGTIAWPIYWSWFFQQDEVK